MFSVNFNVSLIFVIVSTSIVYVNNLSLSYCILFITTIAIIHYLLTILIVHLFASRIDINMIIISVYLIAPRTNRQSLNLVLFVYHLRSLFNSKFHWFILSMLIDNEVTRWRLIVISVSISIISQVHC